MDNQIYLFTELSFFLNELRSQANLHKRDDILDYIYNLRNTNKKKFTDDELQTILEEVLTKLSEIHIHDTSISAPNIDKGSEEDKKL